MGGPSSSEQGTGVSVFVKTSVPSLQEKIKREKTDCRSSSSFFSSFLPSLPLHGSHLFKLILDIGKKLGVEIEVKETENKENILKEENQVPVELREK